MLAYAVRVVGVTAPRRRCEFIARASQTKLNPKAKATELQLNVSACRAFADVPKPPSSPPPPSAPSSSTPLPNARAGSAGSPGSNSNSNSNGSGSGSGGGSGGGGGGLRWLLVLGALGASGIAALLAVDVPEDSPQWLLTAQAHTRSLFGTDSSVPPVPPVKLKSAPNPGGPPAHAAAAKPVVTKEEKPQQQAPTPTPAPSPAPTPTPSSSPSPSPSSSSALSSSSSLSLSQSAPPAPSAPSLPSSATSDGASVSELLARIAALEQRGPQSSESLSQLVHEFQRERVLAHEAHTRHLSELRTQMEQARAEDKAEHSAALEAQETRLRVEYEATVARLGAELAASYASQLERLLSARDADVAREYATLSARVQETLAQTDAVAAAVHSRSESVRATLDSLHGEHGDASDALQLADATADLRRAVLSGAPLEAALTRAQKITATPFPAVHAALSAVPSSARGGVQSHSALSSSLTALEPSARRAADSSASGKLKEWLVQPPAGLVQGDDAASVLARARFHAERGALSASLHEVSSLPAASQEVLKDWRAQATARVHVDETIQLAEAQVAAQARAFSEAH